MNVFRRPMFRGGPVDSRGTGITSGLSYGGRVGLQGGGMPPTGSTFNINMGGRTPIPTQSTVQTGGGIMNRLRNIPYLRALIPAAGGTTAAAAPFIAGAGGGITLGMLADFYARGSSTPEGYARLKEMGGPNFNFDETNIDVGEVFKYIDEGNQMGEKYGFFPRGGKAKRLEELGLSGTYDPKSGKRLENPLGDKKEEKALTADQIKILEQQKLIEELLKKPAPAKETDTEESVEIDKEKFAKILGRDKARGQDIADMLLSFSSKALAPEATVKSAFAEFAADEVKRPSRARKIDDSAAALAINKYIKGEISKQEAEAFLNRAKVQSDLIAERGKLTAGQAFAKSTSPTFAGRVKDAALTVLGEDAPAPKFEVVESKDMKPVEEGGKFKFSQDDVGVIFIETDTRESYTFDSDGSRIPFINA